MPFHNLLSFHRNRLGLSQQAVADLLQTPLRTYTGWEKGSHAPNKITQKVAVATLENLRTDFLPAKGEPGRPTNSQPKREVIVLEPVAAALALPHLLQSTLKP